MYFFAAQVPSGKLDCHSVNEVRAMYGERVVITAVPAFMMTNGTLASVASGAMAIAFGVKITPASRFDLVAHDQLLRQLLRLVRVRPGVVARDQLDLHARRQLLLVLLDVQAHRALHVRPEVAVKPGVAGDEADLDGLTEACPSAGERARCRFLRSCR